MYASSYGKTTFIPGTLGKNGAKILHRNLCRVPQHKLKSRHIQCASEASDKPLVVVGSIIADLVVKVERLPLPGETICGSDLQSFPGGKVGEPTFNEEMLISKFRCLGNQN